MTKQIRAVGLFTALVVACAVAVVLAHEHKVLGTVTTAASDHLTMETPDGKSVTVTVTKQTTVTRDKVAVPFRSIRPGTRVVVTTRSDEAPYVAILIQVGKAPKPRKPS